MYKVLLTTDNPDALLTRVSRQRRYHVMDPILLKDTDTEAVAEAHVDDYVKHPFRLMFEMAAQTLFVLVLLAAISALIGVFACGLVIVLMQFGYTGLVPVGASLAILMVYGLAASRRTALS